MNPRTSPLPLVCLHGWGLNGGIWSALAAPLPAQAVLAPDLPGYGATPAVSPHTVETLADRLAADMPPACVVLGWSLGGMVALAWAARRPEQVRALVLVGTTPAFVNRDGWPLGLAPEVLDGFARDLRRDYRATLLRFLALQARGGEAARSVITRLRDTVFARGEPDPAVLAAGLELLRSVDLRQQPARVGCPTLVVHGGHDTLCPPAAGRWLAEHLPHARLALHERAAHAPFLSHPEWFSSTLAAFLRQLNPSGAGLGASAPQASGGGAVQCGAPTWAQAPSSISLRYE
jgi:pimeloyl-[acyl-carrier protein] methyl ester esterase